MNANKSGWTGRKVVRFDGEIALICIFRMDFPM